LIINQYKLQPCRITSIEFFVLFSNTLGKEIYFKYTRESEMNYKISLRIFSVVFIIIGAMFFMCGPGVLHSFGVKAIPDSPYLNGEIMDFWKMFAFVRLFGTAVMMYGILIGFLAYIEGAKNRKMVSLGSAAGLLILSLVLLTQQIALLETLPGWSLLAVFVLVLIGFILLAFKKEAA
jgi:hypothetical protein